MGRGHARVTTALMGRQIGLLVCSHCHNTVRSGGAMRVRCPRCGAPIHVRKPHSILTTTVLLAGAAVLYVPANLLPVMTTRTFLGEDSDTIMSGVISLVNNGSWPLGLLVFVASICIPLLKLIAMAALLVSVIRQSPGHALQRSQLFRLVEFIGRWSMLDVYAISLLVALVQIRSLAFIHAGLGAIAFCGVVVLTMLAAESFDERLLWDNQPDE
jgi:paraquat-inducible protein A